MSNKRIKKKRAILLCIQGLITVNNKLIDKIEHQQKQIEELKQINSRNAQATNSRFDYLEKKVADKLSKKSWFSRKQEKNGKTNYYFLKNGETLLFQDVSNVDVTDEYVAFDYFGKSTNQEKSGAFYFDNIAGR